MRNPRIIPPLDADPWPTLGGQVCAFIEELLVHGPGDLRGHQARLSEEKRLLIYRAYEVYPRGHPEAGRRRFRRVAISLRKGVAKTELAAWLAAVELHPDGPVRCDGFDARGEPVGRGVTDPYIPLIAYTEEQSEELAYGALRVILAEGPLANDFDIGLERIVRVDGSGKAVALAGAPAARDGARTTFQVADETHRMTLPKQKEAWRTMLANLPKRRMADPWALEITTAFAPGEQSIAESTMDYAKQVEAGDLQDSKLFFFHRQASDRHDTSDPTNRAAIRAAVVEASGSDAEWSDIDGIVDQWQDPTADLEFLERVWLNRPTARSGQAFTLTAWQALQAERVVPAGAAICIGFDGSRFDDATAIVACEIATGHLWPLGIWERPRSIAEWEVPVHEVDGVVADAFARYRVLRMYCDPPLWESWIAKWSGEHGGSRVFEWWTNRRKQMAYAIRAFNAAITTGELSHDGDQRLEAHIGNAHKEPSGQFDDNDRPLWLLRKERKDSPKKIDAAMAAILAWDARLQVIADGENRSEPSIFFLSTR